MSFKTNIAFNSEIMASFLPTVIVSKMKRQTEKNIIFIAVSHEFTCINHEKITKKTSKYDVPVPNINPCTAMGEYSRPGLTKRSLSCRVNS